MVKEEKDHKKLVRVLEDYLEEKDYSVKKEPDTTEYAGYRPDIEAKKGDEILCIEVVNGRKIDSKKVKQKMEALSGNRDCDFGIFVRKEKEKKLKEILKKWGIYYRKIWVFDEG